MSTLKRLVAVAALLGIMLPGAAFAEKRVALLIGNSSYEAVGQLTNPARDVAAMKIALDGAGFDKVDVALDLGRAGMIRTLKDFEDETKGADIALIYYSGHGMEMAGQNYLLPVDVKLASDRDVEDEAIPVERVVRSLKSASRLKLLILDACRNNPFAIRMARAEGSKAVDRGLARVDPSIAGTLIAYAAQPGTVASDGADGNSPYATSLVKRLVEPVDIRVALGNVHDDVLKATNSAQEPVTYSSLGGGQIMLAALPPVVAINPDDSRSNEILRPFLAQPLINPCGDAAAHWAEAKKFDRIDLYQRHLALFGQCAFADFARMKIDEKTKLSALSPTVLRPAVSASPTDCDVLAADPADEEKVSGGVDFNAIDAAKASSACRAALEADPGNRRLTFQLGRALEMAQDYLAAATTYRQAADAGHVQALVALAGLYETGKGGPQDDAKAVVLLRQAVEKDSAAALNEMGFLTMHGRGVERDDAAAARYFKQASDKGSALATSNLAFMFQFGRGVDKNLDQAATLYKAASDSGSNLAAYNLALLYRDGVGVRQDYVEAAKLLRLADTRGYIDAANELGRLYQSGLGIEKNSLEAMQMYKKGSDAGSSYAPYNLAVMYRDGVGVARDPKEAARYFQLSDERGNAYASAELGLMYRDGLGVPTSREQAARLFKKASDAGVADGAFNLGLLYRDGLGVAQDKASAMRLFQFADSRGNAAATLELGFMYETGSVVAPNLEYAAQLYRKAADGGNAIAMDNLGLLYRDGRGVTRDVLQAVTLFQKAIALGNANSMTNLALLYENGNGVQQNYTEAVRLLNAAAAENDLVAMYELGRLIMNGLGAERDMASSASWVAKSIAGGNSFSLKEMTTNARAWGRPFRIAMQLELRQRGVFNGAVDGNFGATTIAALYQLAKG